MICPRTSDYDFFHARLSIHLSSIHREARKGSGDNDPGNSHSRAACGTPCDSRRSAGLLRPLGAPGSGSQAHPTPKPPFPPRPHPPHFFNGVPPPHTLPPPAPRGWVGGTGPPAGLGGSPAFPFFKTSEFQSRAQRALRLKRLPSAHSLQSPAKRRWGLRGSPIVSPSRQTCVSGPGASFCFAEIPVRSRFAP